MPGLSAEPHSAWIWLGGSFVLAVLTANVRWLARDPEPGPLAEGVAFLRGLPGAPVLVQAFRLAYYVGIPFAALLFGRDAVTERYLGLRPFAIPARDGSTSGIAVADNWLDWARDAGWAAAAALCTFGVLLFAWWTYRRALSRVDLRESKPYEKPMGWVLLREAAFYEVHWAFYRNAPLIALRNEPLGAYWGIWLGLGIVGLEAMVNPAWRHALLSPERVPLVLLRVTLALLSALLFWKTQNLWLAVMLHLAISWAMAAIAAATSAGDR